MTSLPFYLLNNAFHLRPHIGGLCGWKRKQILKVLLYLLSLARLWISMGGSCGFCGHVFIVYALYLSLINAVLMSAVIDTSEQRPGLTQCADWFPPNIRGLGEEQNASSGLSLWGGAGRQMLKKNTHQPRLSIFVPATPQVLVFFGSPLLAFRPKGCSKMCFSASQ